MLRITHNEKLFAIVIKSKYSLNEGIEFFTSDTSSQQLGLMNRKKGHIIPPHRHNIKNRNVFLTQEVLFIRKGKIRVDFYTDSEVYVKSIILSEGDCILLADGAHGFEIIEEADIIEVKQGPYIGEEDKVRFNNYPKNIKYV